MNLLELKASELLRRFESPEPTPGGGSASAFSGALSAALVSMVCQMPKTRTGAKEERDRLDAALLWAREAGERLRKLVDLDALAYDGVVAAYRLPKGTEEEKLSRKAQVAEALGKATDVPMRTAEACLVVLKAAQEAARHGNPNARSDAMTAGALAWAGLMGAAENVRINAAALGPTSPGTLGTLDDVLLEARSRARSLDLL